MAGFGDLVQKAFYLGLGMASYAGEKAGATLAELRSQAQKIADEMVERGEITAEEAKRMVDEMVVRAQSSPPTDPQSESSQSSEPRRIEILDDDDGEASPEVEDVEDLRSQVEKLRDELKRMQS